MPAAKPVDPLLPAHEPVALTGSPDGPPAPRGAPEPSGGSCWFIVWLVLGTFALVALLMCWAEVKAALARAWAWVRSRFRKEPKP